MNESTGCSRLYYVIFSRSRCKRWYMRLLDRYFRHITLLRRSDDGDYWIYIGTAGGNVWIDTFPYCPIREVFPDDVIMEYRSVIHQKPTMRIWHLNCVEFVKSVIGVKNVLTITPFQLYRYIKRHGVLFKGE